MANDINARLFALETAFRLLARELDDRNMVSLGQLGDALALEAQRLRTSGLGKQPLEAGPSSAGVLALARDLRETADRLSGATH